MIDFILLLIIGSLWIWGVFAVFDEGNILGYVRANFEGVLGVWILKPVFGCPYCMASIHGFAIGMIYLPEYIQTIPYIICLCGLNFIIKEYLYP